MRFHLPTYAVMLVRLALVIGVIWFGWWGMMGNHLVLVVSGLCLAAIQAVQVKPRKRTSRKRVRSP